METADLNSTIDQMGQINVYRTLHPTVAKYLFFSRAKGPLSGLGHMLGPKTGLSKFKYQI